MSIFKNNPTLTGKVYYTDTDSLSLRACEFKLPENFVGKELGKMKLENYLEEATYLAPKVYGGIIKNNKSLTIFTKVKGLKDSVPYNKLKTISQR